MLIGFPLVEVTHRVAGRRLLDEDARRQRRQLVPTTHLRHRVEPVQPRSTDDVVAHRFLQRVLLEPAR